MRAVSSALKTVSGSSSVMSSAMSAGSQGGAGGRRSVPAAFASATTLASVSGIRLAAREVSCGAA